MRWSITSFALALLLVAGSAAAEEEHRFRLFAGLEPGGSYSDLSGFDFEIGYVLGFDAYVAPRWAVELAASFKDVSDETNSLDAAARFDFAQRGRWSLHGLGGLRYSEYRDVRRPFGPNGNPMTRGFTEERTGVLLGFGADRDLSSRFSLRLDARFVPWSLSGDDAYFNDMTVSAALAVRF